MRIIGFAYKFLAVNMSKILFAFLRHVFSIFCFEKFMNDDNTKISVSLLINSTVN